MLSTQKAIEIVSKHGFDLVGFAPVETLTTEVANLKTWIGKGYQAGMTYMKKNLDRRNDVKEILPSAKSVISLGFNYYQELDYKLQQNEGKISRYAVGRDYHFVLWEKLEQIIAEFKTIDSTFEAKSYVDTGSVMDKAWAVKAGIGWQGKHSNVINRQIGSWFFISNIICNYEFEYDFQIKDYCGTCTACIDACPTQAIVEDYVVDSNRCISYLTIENKGEIDSKLKGKFENWIFGCDICQEVCPWNKKGAIKTMEHDFVHNKKEKISYDEIIELTNSTFKKNFPESPLLRAKAKGLKRNAKFLFGE